MQAYLFKDITPNDKGGEYYFLQGGTNAGFSERFFNRLLQEAPAYYVYDFGTFNIFDGYIDVAPQGADDLYNVTYIAIMDYIGSSAPYRFYKVSESVNTPSGVRFTTTLDLWATYLEKAVLRNVHIKQTNLKLFDKPILSTEWKEADILYKTIEVNGVGASVPIYTPIPLTEDEININDLVWGVVIQFSPSKTIFSQSNLITIAWKDVELDAYGNITADYFQLCNIYEAVSSGTYKIQGDPPAKIQRLYLLPRAFLPLLEGYDLKVKVIDWNATSHNLTLKEASAEYLYSYKKEFLLNFSDIPMENAINIPYIGLNTRFGTILDSIKLESYVGLVKVAVTVILSPEEIKVILTTPDEERDITEAFTLPVVVGETLTGSERIRKVLQVSAQFAGGVAQVASGVSSGNVAAVVSGGVQLGSAFIPGQGSQGAYGGGGNAFVTYETFLSENLNFNEIPKGVLYVITSEAESSRRYKIVNNYGAQCDFVALNSFTTLNSIITNSSYLLSGIATPYIQGEISVENVITAAADEISAVFAQGARLRLII